MALISSYEAFERGWNAGQNQLVYARLAADLDTPVSLMLKLGEARADTFMLESVTGGEVRGRYSVVGMKPDLIWRCRGEQSEINREARFDPQAFAPLPGHPLETLRTLLAECRIEMPDDLPAIAADVMAATESIAPCFEIVDSRINDWKISIVDTVSDNASCGVYVIGDARLDPREFDLPGLHVAVTKNGEPLSEGYGNAGQGDPAQAVAWLANTLGAYGVTLDAGDVILSGSLVPLAPAVKGDTFEMILSDKNPAEGGRALGNCVARFV